MVSTLIALVVDWCWRRAGLVVCAATLLAVLLAVYASSHLSLDTDESHLISSDLPFRKEEQRMDRAFPQDTDLLVAVIDGPGIEAAERAVDALESRLRDDKALFRSVRRPPEEVFFRRHGLLFLSVDELTQLSDRLVAAQPLLGSLSRDPSLRGLLAMVSLAVEGALHGQMDLGEMTPLLEKLAATAATVGDGKTVTPVSWGSLFGSLAERDSPRRFLLTQPVLEFGDLVAGAKASAAIRTTARDLGITPENGFTLRLTGPVALTDANFATVTEGVEISTPLMLLAVCLLLYKAVRSLKVTLAILFSLVIGLIGTAAFAALTVGSLNPISVAFAVMFVGIAVDFAIQFIVRYREERFHLGDERAAMRAAASGMAAPLSLAAIATAVGFLSFLPTEYTGVSQLGLIAGGGMIIALIVDFTLLPALIALVRPGPEKTAYGLPLARADGWLEAHARPVAFLALLLALVGAALLPVLPEDFNPLHLQNPDSEAVATFIDLSRDPDDTSYAIQILEPSEKAAEKMGERLEALPEVRRSLSLGSFVPADQDEKIAILRDLANLLGPSVKSPERRPPPSPEDLLAALRQTADKLDLVAGQSPVAATAAAGLRKVAAAGPAAAGALQDAMVTGLPGQIAQLMRMLEAAPVSRETLPADLVSGWVAADGKARLQAVPKGDMQDHAALVHFVKAVRGIAPHATGMPVNIQQSGNVVIHAFSRAAIGALVAITLLLLIMLRSLLDTLLVILPLIMGALYTVIGCTVFGLAINFANIIALPLLLGIGVAFNIYFVVNWRHGVTGHLQSSTARAVLFSALTTGSAFGSLAVSPHVGTASMGLLLFLSLGLSVCTTFVVLPALFSVLGRTKP